MDVMIDCFRLTVFMTTTVRQLSKHICLHISILMGVRHINDITLFHGQIMKWNLSTESYDVMSHNIFICPSQCLVFTLPKQSELPFFH